MGRRRIRPRCASTAISFQIIDTFLGVFTSIIRSLGVQGVEVEEVYSIEAWAIDHLRYTTLVLFAFMVDNFIRTRAKGLIFCFPHEKDFHPKSDFCDTTGQSVWFANQLSDDACATQAILNVLLNIQDVRLGDEVQSFKDDTADFDSVVSKEYTPISTLC